MSNRMTHSDMNSLGWTRFSSQQTWGRQEDEITNILTLQRRAVLSPDDLLETICGTLDDALTGRTSHLDVLLTEAVAALPPDIAQLLQQRDLFALAHTLPHCRSIQTPSLDTSTEYILLRYGNLPSSVVNRICTERPASRIDWHLGCSGWKGVFRKRGLGYQWIGAVPLDTLGSANVDEASVYSVTDAFLPNEYFTTVTNKHAVEFHQLLDELSCIFDNSKNNPSIYDTTRVDIAMQAMHACFSVSQQPTTPLKEPSLLLPYWP